MELLRQSDLETRRHTARLIDELSLGVSIAPEEERVGTEIAHFFRSLESSKHLYELDLLVWLKVCYAIAMVHPTLPGAPKSEELVVQKAFFDHVWGMRLEAYLEDRAAAGIPRAGFENLASKLNQGNQAHASEIRSFTQAYAFEIAGVWDVYKSKALEIFLRTRAVDRPRPSAPSEITQSEELLRRIFSNAMRLGKLRRKLPTLHVIAMCHAAYRWDKRRRFEANDFMDFHHAAAALGYCDIFLTEKDLGVLLTSGNLRLDKELECEVHHDTARAAEYLSTLRSKR